MPNLTPHTERCGRHLPKDDAWVGESVADRVGEWFTESGAGPIDTIPLPTRHGNRLATRVASSPDLLMRVQSCLDVS
jgi:hypothetical protein